MLSEIIQENRDLILEIAIGHGIKNIRVFGSVARFEDGPLSDIDLLVDFEAGRTLFDLIAFKLQLEEFLHFNCIHVVTENSIHWSIKNAVLKEAIKLEEL